MEHSDEEGIKAIIYLQKMAGIDESHEDASRGWSRMSPSQKDNTMAAYEMFKGREN